MSIPLRLRILPTVPAKVVADAPLSASVQSGILHISLDVSDLAPLEGGVPPTLLSLLFDTVTGTWQIAEVGDFFNLAGAVPAPTLSQVRNALIATSVGVWGWTPIAITDISGGGATGQALFAAGTASAARVILGIQALLDAKANLSHTHATGDISGLGALALLNTLPISAHSNFTGGSKLVGSGAAGATPAEIALGSFLAMSGNTLNVAGVAAAGAFGQAIAGASFAGSTGAIAKSSGITSVVRNATGRYTVTFATAQPDADYIVVGSAANVSYAARETFNPYNQTVSGFQLNTDNGSSDTDYTRVGFLVFRPQ